MNPVLQYFIHVGDATSQLVNTVLFLGDPNESISGRAYRMRDKIQWKTIMTLVDFIMSPFEDQHCQKSYEADIERAKKLLGVL